MSGSNTLRQTPIDDQWIRLCKLGLGRAPPFNAAMGRRVTRRQFSLSASAIAASPQTRTNERPGEENHPMDTRLPDADLDPVRWTLERYKSAPLRLTFETTNRAEAERWQQELRAKLTGLLGGFPQRSALNSSVISTAEFPSYRREQGSSIAGPVWPCWLIFCFPKAPKRKARLSAIGLRRSGKCIAAQTFFPQTEGKKPGWIGLADFPR